MLTVCLHGVGRNLNRAYRTCAAFGVRRMDLHDCTGRVLGSLFGHLGEVQVESVAALPMGRHVLALDMHSKRPLGHVEWPEITTLLVGGETVGLPRGVLHECHTACIAASCLTVEAALAIALYTWSVATC